MSSDLTEDKCESGGHGDGEDYKEDCHSSPWSWTSSEIFGEILEASPPSSFGLAGLDGAESGEVGSECARHLL